MRTMNFEFSTVGKFFFYLPSPVSWTVAVIIGIDWIKVGDGGYCRLFRKCQARLVRA